MKPDIDAVEAQAKAGIAVRVTDARPINPNDVLALIADIRAKDRRLYAAVHILEDARAWVHAAQEQGVESSEPGVAIKAMLARIDNFLSPKETKK